LSSDLSVICTLPRYKSVAVDGFRVEDGTACMSATAVGTTARLRAAPIGIKSSMSYRLIETQVASIRVNCFGVVSIFGIESSSRSIDVKEWT
jgi:hypothetical protein